MAKNREAVTCNGRTAFYACMWEDIRQCAMDCGWAVSLHGSLASDMDIMAMPWVENAVSFKEMIDRVSKLFKDNELSSQYVITYNDKPHGRVVATIPIWADFYLDISTINTADVVPKSEVERLNKELDELAEELSDLIVEKDYLFDEVVRLRDTIEVYEETSGSKQAKTEVAREIILEIDTLICCHANGDIDDKRLYILFDELKKKYIGGDTNGS